MSAVTDNLHYKESQSFINRLLKDFTGEGGGMGAWEPDFAGEGGGMGAWEPDFTEEGRSMGA